MSADDEPPEPPIPTQKAEYVLLPVHFAVGCTQLPDTLEKRLPEPSEEESLEDPATTYPDQFALEACWTSAEATEVQAGTAPSAHATVTAEVGMSLFAFISNTVGRASKKRLEIGEEATTNSRRDSSAPAPDAGCVRR